MKEDDPDPRETKWHPRLNARLIGHADAERALIDGWAAGRLHHAWLIAGPKGIGKATLAYRFARFLTDRPEPTEGEAPPQDLAVPATHRAFRHMAARSLPDLLVVEPAYDGKKKQVKAETGVDEARKAAEFFTRTAAGGGWRVAIVDAADDLNPNAANALLKIIEEPPPSTVVLMIAHAPGRLIATIRSRCRLLELQPLSPGDVKSAISGLPQEALAGRGPLDTAIALGEGSPGRMLELAGSAAAEAFVGFTRAMDTPHPDGSELRAIAQRLGGRESLEDFRLFGRLVGEWVAHRARDDTRGGRLPRARAFAEAHRTIGHSLREANTLNLDRRETLARLLTTVAAIEASNP